MVDPGAHVVEGYEPIMPDMTRTLSSSQIWALIAYLQSQGGEVTVEASDIEIGADEAGGADGAGRLEPTGQAVSEGAPEGAAAALQDPMALLRAHTCLACHVLGGEGGPIGPAFDDIGATRDAAYIRRSILEPNADTAAGYEAVAGTMPATFGQQLTAAQLESIVRFLADQEGGG
jgi:mono/diheme cytochrome c family protein